MLRRMVKFPRNTLFCLNSINVTNLLVVCEHGEQYLMHAMHVNSIFRRMVHILRRSLQQGETSVKVSPLSLSDTTLLVLQRIHWFTMLVL